MRPLLRWLACVLLAGLALQLFFVARIALMGVVAPQSTAFQRSEAWEIARHGRINTPGQPWRQRWVPYDQLPDSLKRAVLASEDADFISHRGVEWDAVENARLRNARAEALAA
ncbi:MAG: monofunctional biosynthetic peptidoglycan transglycosylase, partial [Variovorax sp.]|nr:monofunctional biosynthetic peptidoglycan transglycosylase [Variovorax sp.]